MDLISVYLAGKISHTDWRHDIFPRLRDAEDLEGEQGKLVLDATGRFVCVGPRFISCDHGCFHGPHTHGRGTAKHVMCAERMESQEEVVSKCVGWLKDSAVVFAWIDEADVYGTLIELGMAYSLGKPIFLGMPVGYEKLQDFWFAQIIASSFVSCDNHMTVWGIFTKTVKRKSSVRKPTPPKLRFQIFKRDDFTCRYCGRKAPDVVLEIDHLVPVAKGGADDVENLLTSCEKCNRGKGVILLSDRVK